jgi:hypothetical protein
MVLRHHVMSAFKHLCVLLESYSAQRAGRLFLPKKSCYWIAAVVGSLSLKVMGSWAAERCDTDEFLRQVGINQQHHFTELEIAWIFLEHAQGKRHARQTATALLDWVRHSLKSTTLVSYIDRQNLRSIAPTDTLVALPDPESGGPGREVNEYTIVCSNATEVA